MTADPGPSRGTGVTRVAIEFLTLWLEDDRQAALDHIAGVLDASPESAWNAIVGLLNLGTAFAFDLARAGGAADADSATAWVSAYLQRLSARLPEPDQPDDTS